MGRNVNTYLLGEQNTFKVYHIKITLNEMRNVDKKRKK